jgi:hypothetical protein
MIGLVSKGVSIDDNYNKNNTNPKNKSVVEVE